MRYVFLKNKYTLLKKEKLGSPCFTIHYHVENSSEARRSAKTSRTTLNLLAQFVIIDTREVFKVLKLHLSKKLSN